MLTNLGSQAQYHPYCPIKWGNTTSEQDCWLGDEKVPLPDLNTEDPIVISGLSAWVKDMVTTYGIDGLRIDGTRHSTSLYCVTIIMTMVYSC